MRDVTEKTLTDAVLATIAADADPRFREIMTALIRHLHGFAAEVDLTKEEWLAAIDFLCRTGWKTTPKRNEFILLSDTLGLSSLVDMISSRGGEGATEVSVLGPFYIAGSPMIENGGDLIRDNAGEQGVVSGRVLSVDGAPVAGAEVRVVQAATGFERLVTSAANGWFASPIVPPGSYDVHATSGSLRSIVFRTTVRVGAVTTVDLQVTIEVPAEEVTVVAGLRRRDDHHGVGGWIGRTDIDHQPLGAPHHELRLIGPPDGIHVRIGQPQADELAAGLRARLIDGAARPLAEMAAHDVARLVELLDAHDLAAQGAVAALLVGRRFGHAAVLRWAFGRVHTAVFLTSMSSSSRVVGT